MATSGSSSLLSERLQEGNKAPPPYTSAMTITGKDKSGSLAQQQQVANSLSAAQAMESFKQLAAASTDGGKSLLLQGLEGSLAQGLALLARGSQPGDKSGVFPNAAQALEAIRPFLEGGNGGLAAARLGTPAPEPQGEVQATKQPSVTNITSRDDKTRRASAVGAPSSPGETETTPTSGRAYSGRAAPTKTTNSGSSSSNSQKGPQCKPATTKNGFANPRHDAVLVHAIRELYQEEFGLDVVLLAEGGHVAAHCAVLAASSPFLKDLLLQDNDHTKIISITGTSLVALQGILVCLYQGEIPPGISLHALAEAAKLLHMDGLLFVLQNAILAQGGTPLEPLCHPRVLTEMGKGGSEKSGVNKSMRLDQILYQKLNVDHLAPSETPEPPSSDPNHGILGELLTKTDPQRSYLGQSSSDLGYDSLRTPLKPLNLTKPNKSNAQTTPTSSSAYFSTPVPGTPSGPNLSALSSLNSQGDLGLSALSSYGPALSSAAATAAMSGLLTPITPSNLSTIMSEMPPLSSLTSQQALDTLALQQQLLSPTSVPSPRNKSIYNKNSGSGQMTNDSSNNSLSNSSSQKSSNSRNNKNNRRSASSSTSSSQLSNQYANHFLMKNLAGITPEIAKGIYEQMQLNPQLASLAGIGNMNNINPLSSSASLQSLANLHNLSNLPGFPPLFPYQATSTSGSPPTVYTKLPPTIGGGTASPSSTKKSSQQIVPGAMSVKGDQLSSLANKTVVSSIATSNAKSASGSLANMASLAGMTGVINTNPADINANSSGRSDSPEVVSLVTNGSTVSSQSSTSSFQAATKETIDQNKPDEKVKSLLVDVSDVPTSILPPHMSSRELLCLPTTINTPGSEGSLVYVSPSMPTSAAMVASSLSMSIPGTMSFPINGSGLMTTTSIGGQATPTMVQTDMKFSDPAVTYHGIGGLAGDEHSGSVSSPEIVEIIEEIPGDPQSAIRRTLYHPGHMGRKRKGCGECEGCQVVEDCSQCRFCRDKAKFGGPNRLKQVCVYKRCVLAEAVENAAAAEETKKRRKMGLKKKNGKCGTCDGCQRATDCGECYACLHNAAVQPPARRKICEMRVCEQQQIEDFRVSLTIAAEPSPYSAESLLAESAGLSSPFSASSPTSESQPSTHNDKMKLMRKMLKKKFAQPYSRVSPSKVRTKYYCGECPGCQTTTPCGHCLYCSDMPKFGGPGRYRQKCVKQLCVYHPRLQALKLSNRSKITYDEQHINVDTLTQLGASYQQFLAEHPEALAMWPEGVAMFAGYSPGVKMEEDENTFDSNISMENQIDPNDGVMDEEERNALQKHYKDVQIQEMERKAKQAAEAAAIAKVANDATSIPAIISAAMPTNCIPKSAISTSVVGLANAMTFTTAVDLTNNAGSKRPIVNLSNASGLSSASFCLGNASSLSGVAASLSSTSGFNSTPISLSNAIGVHSAATDLNNTLVKGSLSSSAVQGETQEPLQCVEKEMHQEVISVTVDSENDVVEDDNNPDNNGDISVVADEAGVGSGEKEELSASSLNYTSSSTTSIPISTSSTSTTSTSSPAAQTKVGGRNSNSSRSSNSRGRARGRGGRGRGNTAASAAPQATTRTMCRRTPRFNLGPQDHNEFEEQLLLAEEDGGIPKKEDVEVGVRSTATGLNDGCEGGQPPCQQNIQLEEQKEDLQSEEKINTPIEVSIGSPGELPLGETKTASGRIQIPDCFSFASVSDECGVDSDEENNVNIKNVIASLDSINDEEEKSL
ncbi:unnamed protein product [Meganyctiphanes norvegica]|uniref:Uncharacterized protein n=1 Tax=Meganyctiphanes norvegica TaxID=48144 RepID=A0AAV2RTB3_MEGNR